ncbi:MAG: N-acetylmuramoyl-L-alanine amidase [Gammaproteobacteria bacterium]|jgi:N-acetylmuramoyl-L-alanine amidase
MANARNNFQRRVFLSRALRLSGAAAATFIAPNAFAHRRVLVRNVKLVHHHGITRVIFDLDGPVRHRLFTLSHPDRVVIDVADAHTGRLHLEPTALVHDLRYAPHEHGGLRLVLDLSTAARPHSLLLPPDGSYRTYRLVVDLTPVAGSTEATRTAHGRHLRDVIITIDPGHGGRDPGAIGQRGTYEKTVVLDIGHRLNALLEREDGMKPMMTRHSDHFVTLGGRVRMAEAHRADLFVSIHADASPYHYPKGSTIYVLSEHGASSVAARLLAKHQNSADRLAGVNLSGYSKAVTSVLIDMEQTATHVDSTVLARHLTESIAHADIVPLHSREVEHAAFVVLKSPDIPSVLVETAFISNRSEERLLQTPTFRQGMAEALLGGIKEYFREHAPPGTVLEARHRASDLAAS